MKNLRNPGLPRVRGLDLIDFIKSKLYRVSSVGNGDNIVALCPFHDDHTPSFSMNVNTGAFICFSCGAKGGIHKLARRVLTPTEYVALEDTLNDFVMYSAANRLQDGVVFDEDEMVSYTLDIIPPLDVRISDFKKIAILSPYINTVNRHILSHYLVGTYKNSVCFPYITREYTVAGIKCRALSPLPGMPKYYTLTSKNCETIPPAFTPNYGDALFGYTTLPLLFPDTDFVFLVEGPKDVILWAGLGIPAVATTDDLSETQISLLAEFDTVVLVGDNDFAGKTFMRKWRKSLEGLVAIKSIKYPEDVKTLNPVDMPWPILSKLIEKLI